MSHPQTQEVLIGTTGCAGLTTTIDTARVRLTAAIDAARVQLTATIDTARGGLTP